MKRIVSLVLALLFSACLGLACYATEDLSGDPVTSEPPVASEPVSSEEEVSSEPEIASSEPETSSDVSSLVSSEQSAVTSQVDYDEPDRDNYVDDTVSIGAADNGNDGNRGAIILVFCYIITALIGVCLVGLIIANVYIPISNKKRELAELNNDEDECDYKFYKHSPKGKKEKRRPRGKM